jgi:hypothetical protein
MPTDIVPKFNLGARAKRLIIVFLAFFFGLRISPLFYNDKMQSHDFSELVTQLAGSLGRLSTYLGPNAVTCYFALIIVMAVSRVLFHRTNDALTYLFYLLFGIYMGAMTFGRQELLLEGAVRAWSQEDERSLILEAVYLLLYFLIMLGFPLLVAWSLSRISLRVTLRSTPDS